MPTCWTARLERRRPALLSSARVGSGVTFGPSSVTCRSPNGSCTTRVRSSSRPGPEGEIRRRPGRHPPGPLRDAQAGAAGGRGYVPPDLRPSRRHVDAIAAAADHLTEYGPEQLRRLPLLACQREPSCSSIAGTASSVGSSRKTTRAPGRSTSSTATCATMPRACGATSSDANGPTSQPDWETNSPRCWTTTSARASTPRPTWSRTSRTTRPNGRRRRSSWLPGNVNIDVTPPRESSIDPQSHRHLFEDGSVVLRHSRLGKRRFLSLATITPRQVRPFGRPLMPRVAF